MAGCRRGGTAGPRLPAGHGTDGVRGGKQQHGHRQGVRGGNSDRGTDMRLEGKGEINRATQAHECWKRCEAEGIG